MKPNISITLKELRKNNNNTQIEVAEFLGISRQAYSRYESNLREPDMETLSKIAIFYKVSPQVFYINDINKLLEPNMNIVEMLARYQLKSTIYQDYNNDEGNYLDSYFPKQDEKQIKDALSKYFDLEEKPKKHITLR